MPQVWAAGGASPDPRAVVIGHALIRFPEGGEITREDWEAFCAPLEIVYAPQAVGLNVYYHGGRQGVECAFGIGSRGVAGRG